jgi:curved DNA-binding protein CbpA
MLVARWRALGAQLSHARRLAPAAFSSSPPPPSPPPRSPYAVLGVDRRASPAQIKAAFRKQALRLHPDRAGAGPEAAAAFLELADAFEALADPVRRRAADDADEAGTPAGASGDAQQARPPPRRPPRPTAPHESPSYDERDMPPFLRRWFEQERQRRRREREARAARAAAGGKVPWPFSVAEEWFVGSSRGGGGGGGAGGGDESDSAAPQQQQQQQQQQQGGPLDPASAEAVAGALARCRAALQDELHSALMLAFFGPRAPRRGLPPGHLPPAFEAEERADPRLTPDLLHLVSGRTLLGVVRERRPLLLTGARGDGAAGALGDEDAALALPLVFAEEEEGGGGGALAPASAAPAAPAAAEDPRQVLREVLGAEASADARGPPSDAAESADAAASTSWTAEHEAEVLRRLDAPHALRGRYAWAPGLPPEALLGGQRGSLLAMPPLPPLLLGGAAALPSSSSSTTTPGIPAIPAPSAPVPSRPRSLPSAAAADGAAADDDDAPADGALGAARGRAAWDASVAGRAARPVWETPPRNNDDADDDPFHRPDAAELALRRARALAAAHASAERARRRRWRRLIAAPTADWVPDEWAFDDRSPGVTVLELALTPRGGDEAAAGAAAATGGDDDGGGGGGGGGGSGVIAVGVRHEDPWALRELGLQRESDGRERGQRGRFGGLFGGLLGPARAPLPAHARYPLKIYVGGRFVAAALDDVLMEPHTGDLLAAVYRMSSPGVSHLWFLRPQQPAPRLLARLKRGWLPPSATWLFPPRAPGTHDVGGWYVEAERAPGSGGAAASNPPSLQRPGHIHPAVFLMVAAFASLDAERRRDESRRRRRGNALLERGRAWLFGGGGKADAGAGDGPGGVAVSRLVQR